MEKKAEKKGSNFIDAKGMVAGRLATYIAKDIMKGDKVVVFNAEEVIVVGGKDSIIEKYKRRVDAAVKSNPNYGPKYSRIPSRMFRKMVRNMLPTQKRTKERMIKNLMVYNAVPKEYANEKARVIENARCNERQGFMTFKEIAQQLGGRW